MKKRKGKAVMMRMKKKVMMEVTLKKMTLKMMMLVKLIPRRML